MMGTESRPGDIAVTVGRRSRSAPSARMRPSGALDPDGRILAVNGGSSSIKFALFGAKEPPARIFEGRLEGIGGTAPRFFAKDLGTGREVSKDVHAADRAAAVGILMEWVADRMGSDRIVAVGHRIVHGGPRYWKAQRITPEMVEELRRMSPFDPEHLPEEILLATAMQDRFPDLPQVACFDTAFHHDLPRSAAILPIPRRYEALGIRRYGFHGLSYEHMMDELLRLGDPAAKRGRVVLAHLGGGSSLAAVLDGKCHDTTMGFTPSGGLPMGTRSGDLDPGLIAYLARIEGMDIPRFAEMVDFRSGLLGISETCSDMRELLELEGGDSRAAEAVEFFCYQAGKWIGAFAAALGGIDTLVFSGGVGENAASIRDRICRNLGFLGVRLDATRNAAGTGRISASPDGVAVRVVRADEESAIARSVARVLGAGNGAMALEVT